jgi:hypothetical protein
LPSVVLLQLESESWYEEMYKDFLKPLRAKSKVIPIKTVREAEDVLETRPHAVLITDGGIMYKQHRAVQPMLVDYARNGGHLIVAGLFATMDSKPCVWHT